MTTPHSARILLVLGLALLALAPVTAQPGTVTAASLTFTVTSTADAPDAHPGDGLCATRSGQCTLRAAIQEADAQPAGSSITITVPAGTYGLSLGTLQLTANRITISGALSSTTTISGTNTSTVLAISSTVQARLSGVTITGGNAASSSGGGIFNAGELTVQSSSVLSNTARLGGGILNAPQAELRLSDSTVRGNQAGPGGGGGLDNFGTVTLQNSTLSGNAATDVCTPSGRCVGGNGGGIRNYGTLTVTNSILSGNTASSGCCYGIGGAASCPIIMPRRA